MKNLNKYKFNLWVLSLVCLLGACQPDSDFPNLDDPLSIKTASLSGTWVVQKVTLFDQEAIDNGFPEAVQKQDITAKFPFAEFEVKFDIDNQGNPSTFTVTPGNAPNFLSLNTGQWSVDHPIFTTTIRLFDTTNPNASSFRVKQINKDLITLQFLRNANDSGSTLYLFYEYEMKRK
jgi:Domain of unknown function (DUF5004)